MSLLRTTPWLMSIALGTGLVSPAEGREAIGCLITPSSTVEIGSPSIGIVQKMHVERGDDVRSNQVLVTLRADTERAHLNLAAVRAAAEAERQSAARAHDFAQRKLERAQDLFRQEFVSAQAVDQATAEEHAARARKAHATEQSLQAKKELLVAQVEVDARTIRSPIDGVVIDVYRRAGERVEEKPMLKIATMDPLHVEVVLPSSLYGRLKVGSALSVQPAFAGLYAVAGTVKLVDRFVDPASNTFRARIVLPNADRAIPAGLRCQVLLPGDGKGGAAGTAP